MGSLATRIGEISIPRNTLAFAIGARRKPRLGSQQMDLFASRVAKGAPDWTDLPKDARERWSA